MMYLRWICTLAVAAALGACTSVPGIGDRQGAMRDCHSMRDAGACRLLAVLLATDEVPPTDLPEVEETVLRACWSDRLVDARLGTDSRWRLCYEVGKHFSARAVKAMEAPDTNFRKVAAHLYLRACELGQPQACRLLISECLLLDESMCAAPPSEEQASQWAAQRRDRDARAQGR